MKIIRKTLLSATVLLTITGAAQAALLDRGGGLIYDTALNVTWLQDADYARTSGYVSPEGPINANGSMTYYQADTWALDLNYYDSVRNVTYSDWRLPIVKPLEGSAVFNSSSNYNYSNNGSTNVGLNISEQGTAYAGSTVSEMAHLFYNSLNNKSSCDPVASTASSCVSQTGYGLTNTGPFINLQSGEYWTNTDYKPGFATSWVFDFGYGSQGYGSTDNFLFAVAVRSGDVASVPVPAAVWLLGSGLLGFFGVARRKAA